MKQSNEQQITTLATYLLETRSETELREMLVQVSSMAKTYDDEKPFVRILETLGVINGLNKTQLVERAIKTYQIINNIWDEIYKEKGDAVVHESIHDFWNDVEVLFFLDNAENREYLWDNGTLNNITASNTLIRRVRSFLKQYRVETEKEFVRV